MGTIKVKLIFFAAIISFMLPFYGIAQKKVLSPHKHKFVVIARRGDHENVPENTLAAYQKAIEDGADFIEADLRTTKDNQLVIMHNANIKDMTGYDAEIKDLLFDTLRTKKISNAFNPEWGQHIIPTLKEVLQLCKGKINICIDFKEADVTETFKEILAAGMQEHVVIYVDEPRQLQNWGTVAPMIPLMMDLPETVKTKEEMAQLWNSFNIDLLSADTLSFNNEAIKAAKEKQVPVWYDIPSENETMDQWNALSGLDINGLQTNHPKELIEFLNEKGMR